MADKITKKELTELQEKAKELDEIKQVALKEKAKEKDEDEDEEEEKDKLKKGDFTDENDGDEDEPETDEENYCSECGQVLVNDKIKVCPNPNCACEF